MAKDIQETVSRLVVGLLTDRGIAITPLPDTSLIDSGLIDSTSVVTFVGQLEEAFEITIAMADMTLDNFDNIQLISDLVRTKLAEL